VIIVDRMDDPPRGTFGWYVRLFSALLDLVWTVFWRVLVSTLVLIAGVIVSVVLVRIMLG
jgi:hypothetical protein